MMAGKALTFERPCLRDVYWQARLLLLSELACAMRIGRQGSCF